MPFARRSDEVILSISSIRLHARDGHKAGFPLQAHPPHPPSIRGLQGSLVGWHVLLLSCQLTCRRLPYTDLSLWSHHLDGQLVQPCQSHTVLNARRLVSRLSPDLQLHLRLPPAPSSPGGPAGYQATAPLPSVVSLFYFLPVTKLLASRSLSVIFCTTITLVHVRPPPSSIASL